MQSVDSRLREMIGDMAVNLVAAQASNELVTGQRNAAYEALHACILTGQVPESEVPKLLASNPDFAAWRASRSATDS